MGIKRRHGKDTYWKCSYCNHIEGDEKHIKAHEKWKHGVCAKCGKRMYHGGQCLSCGAK
jgi:transcription elongation factor Elf1